MSTNKADIQQIQKYLNGELDAKAMHALERRAQDDPFLMDAIEGYETIGTDQQGNLDEVKQRFTKRQERNANTPLLLWRSLTIAATLLIVLSAGLLILKPKHHEQLTLDKPVLPAPTKTQNTTVISPPVTDDKHVAGIITDATGHTLEGVKVHIKGTQLSAKTDSNGRFSIASAAKGTLSIAAYGYDTKQVSLKDKNNLKVVLNESSNQLASVSVTAYVEDDKPANKTHPTIGWKAFRDYLRKNAFVETGETGLVKLAFTVDTTGIIKGIHVIKGKNVAMNQKAVDLIMNGPDWKGITPGETRLKILFRKAKES